MGCPIILVIDGNTENHKLFQSYLGNDFEVVCISTGRSAVELVGAKRLRSYSFRILCQTAPDLS
ncbi:MAG: hypothetical protein ACE5I1_12830 [bacterium]